MMEVGWHVDGNSDVLVELIGLSERTENPCQPLLQSSTLPLAVMGV